MVDTESMKKTHTKVIKALQKLNKIIKSRNVNELMDNPEDMTKGMRKIQDIYFAVSKISNDNNISDIEKKNKIKEILKKNEITLKKKELELLVNKNNKKGGSGNWTELEKPKFQFIKRIFSFFDIKRFTRILFNRKLKKSDKLEKIVDLTPYPIIFKGNPFYRRLKAVINDLYYYDVFFPLHVASKMSPTFDMGLDFMGMGLDISQIGLTFVTPLLDMGAKAAPIAVDAAQAVPGAGTAIAPVAMVINLYNLFGDYITAAIEGFGNYIGLLYNISRKEWTLAFISLTSFIPNYSVFLDFFLTFTKAFNKAVQKIGFNPSIIHPIKNIHTKLNIFLEEFIKFITSNLHLVDRLKLPDLGKIRKKIFKI